MNGKRLILLPCLLLLSVFLFGCSRVAPAKLLSAQQDETQRAQWSLEIRFPAEGNALSTTLSGDSQSFSDISQIISESSPLKNLPVKPFPPELMCDVEIDYIHSGSDEELSFLYSSEYNVLVYKQYGEENGKTVFQYSMFSPDPAMANAIQLQRQMALLAAEEQAKAQGPAMNAQELKVQIDPDKLGQEGEERNFEFYTGELEQEEGTAVKVYTNADKPDIPEGKILFVAMGSDASGKPVKLSITGFEENDEYTKFFVSLPEADDGTGDQTDDGADDQSNAILVDTNELNPDKWIVFLQDSGEVMDVVLPEQVFTSTT